MEPQFSINKRKKDCSLQDLKMGASSDPLCLAQSSSATGTNKQTQFLSLRSLQVVTLAFDKQANTPKLSFSTSATREETRVHPVTAAREPACAN